MKALIVKALVGSGLFAGSLVGGLAATGRLNHEGVANIPVLNALFPAPPPAAGGDGAAEAGHAAGADGHAAPGDAAHAGGDGHAADAAAGGEPGPQGPAGLPSKPPTREVGRSVVEPEKKAEGGGHGGGGHGEPAADDHGKGDGGHGEAATGQAPAPAGESHAASPDAKAKAAHPAERDLQQLGQELARDRRHKYAPGGYFTFEGMPAGLTPEQLNDAWQRVQSVLADLDRRKTALDLREQALKEMNEDIARRQRSIADELRKIEEQHRRLDQRIQQFQEQVKLVRNDEVAALKRNAATLASFEDAKAAELIEDQWKSEKGQDEVLKTLEFMDKDRVNEILAALPKALVQDLLQKRLRVSKEATPAGPGR